MLGPRTQNKYEIKIYGQIDDSWLDWFGETKAHVEILADNSHVTTFSNVIMDQAGLVGLIRRFTWTWDRAGIHSASVDIAFPG